MRNGKKILFTKMNKALYGHMLSARLFWEYLSDTLKKYSEKQLTEPNAPLFCISMTSRYHI